MKTQLAQRRASTTPVVGVEATLRNAGASVLAATGILASPWILFAIAYKTYIYFTTGTWYFLGAPTPHRHVQPRRPHGNSSRSGPWRHDAVQCRSVTQESPTQISTLMGVGDYYVNHVTSS
ncbi:hypothetical protein FV141_13450 [Dermacoccus abyssi]|uniref:Uncharacterized protein n=1 Tax=Dermacoccus abyssi TaxID=322596 RepID=A0ABX5ZF91_9MICO|nr:hypothetical protein FV141_13450 [Dermacoccus abyssi]